MCCETWGGSDGLSVHCATHSSQVQVPLILEKVCGSAAMLTVRRSAGVAPEVNLRNPLHTGDEAHHPGIHLDSEAQYRQSPKVQNRVISGPQKGLTNVLQIVLKRKRK